MCSLDNVYMHRVGSDSVAVLIEQCDVLHKFRISRLESLNQ